METRFVIAMICVAFVGALIIGLSMSIGAAIIGSFYSSVLKGIISIICPIVGYIISWYIIKIPERRYLKEQED